MLNTRYPSLMHEEAAQAPESVRKLLSTQVDVFERIAETIRQSQHEMVITNARGSSDHASVFGKYLIMQKLGIPVLSGPPSIASIYGSDLKMNAALCISVSQSGQSPDIVKAAQSYGQSGAFTVAFTNTVNSPLAACSDEAVNLCTGAENSVAATKSYITSLAAFLALLAHWSDEPLQDAIGQLPDLLEEAARTKWDTALDALVDCNGLFVVGRGPSLGIAGEAALKFKETCQIHAEAFSAAECSHGPLALVGPKFPVVMFVQDDASRASTLALGKHVLDLGAPLLVAGAKIDGAINLPTIEAPAELAPILMVQSFYRTIADLALARGQDPDSPPALKKVTKTL